MFYGDNGKENGNYDIQGLGFRVQINCHPKVDRIWDMWGQYFTTHCHILST